MSSGYILKTQESGRGLEKESTCSGCLDAGELGDEAGACEGDPGLGESLTVQASSERLENA